MLDAKISVLVSGGGTNLQALLDAQASGILKSGKIVQVISSRKDAKAIERARMAGVRADVAEFRNFSNPAAFERRLWKLLEEARPDLVVLAGFMHILSREFVARYKGRMVNVHPSLIPAFCGKGFYGQKVHEAVLASGVKVTGATVHIVDAVPDGGPILMQKAVDVAPDDTPESLQRRVMEQAEWVILPKAVEELCQRLEPPASDFGVRGNPYPGRGIILGCAPDNSLALAYFIMGRSASSRARAFERFEDGLAIRIPDPSNAALKDQDLSLILYSPIRRLLGSGRDDIIVTNGDQTDTIYETMKAKGTFEDALRTRTFEPDAPHFTPRISGLVTTLSDQRSYRLSILKAGPGGTCCRQFFEYEPCPGVGHLIHTYDGNGEVLPSFNGEPKPVDIPEDIDDLANGLWDALDSDNKVSLYVRYISLSGKYDDRLFNKYEGEDEGL